MESIHPQSTGTNLDRAGAGEVQLGELCDACGQVVPPGEGIKAELTVSGAMCPSPMNFHTDCAEKASELWHPDPDSYCTTDPLYPETGQWTLPEETRG
ncbi:MAG: hypothetical protein H0T70_02535 [Acidimicrobiia bacterium]|nr:hypothetical protein [Acidimicrobiia bacterium]